ncbi:MAG: hypothetical protein LAO51_02760 [Acidobacteriia bacterium]|nr:hypothetical protein [Terriglobia bacterium]
MAKKKAARKSITVANLVAALSASEMYLCGVRQALISMGPNKRVPPPLPAPHWGLFVAGRRSIDINPVPICLPRGGKCWPDGLVPPEKGGNGKRLTGGTRR